MAVTDDAILRIKAMITSGQLRPGDRLPPEAQLGEQLGVSRSSLREAVKALEVIRVLDVRRGDGTYVTSLEPRLLLEALSFVIDLHVDQSVLEIFEVRRLLEPAVASVAAGALTDESLAHLTRMIDEVDVDGPVEDLVSHDLAFHQRIVDAAGNTYLSSLFDTLQNGTERARIWRGITQEGAAERTISEHRAILHALRDHDATLASALTLTHIAGIERWLRRASTDGETTVEAAADE